MGEYELHSEKREDTPVDVSRRPKEAIYELRKEKGTQRWKIRTRRD
jgi:hypothetical protein